MSQSATASIRARIGPTERFTSDDLAAALDGEIDLEALISEARFGEDRYVRVPLHRGEHYELRLLCWAPGQSSALHGHGDSSCAFRVLRGQATELRLDGAITQLSPGDIGVARPEHIHQVANLGDTPLITLHAYAPPLPIEQPSSADGRQIVVIGGGFSGAALIHQLARREDPTLRVTWVEPNGALGHGVAYKTTDPAHLLNVPAGGMSIDPAIPHDFLSFAQERVPGVTRASLLPRALYAQYLTERIACAITSSRVKFRLARTEAADVSRNDAGLRVHLVDGRLLDADEVVLATGHGPTRVPEAVRWLQDDPAVTVDPWARGALGDLPANARVLVVGTGLTATDVLLTLRGNGQRGPVVAASRGGRWPKPHLPTVVWSGGAIALDVEAAPRTADGLAAWVRARVASAKAGGVPWQAVFGALREHVSWLWERLPIAERSRFLAVHRPEWEPARHRTPVQNWEALAAWREDGWLQDLRGDLTAVVRTSEGLTAEFETDHGPETVTVDRIILATGNESDPRRFDSPLWSRLLQRGLAVADPLGLGVQTDGDGALIAADGAAQTDLYALGGLVRPRYFEVTSVPDVSIQVATVAAALLASVPEPASPQQVDVVGQP
jgi:uncharacterized NAD(P)/FAD-binding protein YdhS/mannose-6-phosphate isomerase-like protein (cupin superfamily)